MRANTSSTVICFMHWLSVHGDLRWLLADTQGEQASALKKNSALGLSAP